MRNFEFSPFMRNAVGFETLFDLAHDLGHHGAVNHRFAFFLSGFNIEALGVQQCGENPNGDDENRREQHTHHS